jgi:hypothetical protein
VPGFYDPIPELERDDGDVTTMLIFKDSYYSKPVDDPLFSAHKPSGVSDLGDPEWLNYESDEPVSALGCFSQVSSTK